MPLGLPGVGGSPTLASTGTTITLSQPADGQPLVPVPLPAPQAGLSKVVMVGAPSTAANLPDVSRPRSFTVQYLDPSMSATDLPTLTDLALADLRPNRRPTKRAPVSG